MAVKVIGLGDFRRMAVDTETGRLYWDGKEVVTTMALPWWVHVAAIATAISTVVIAVVSVVHLFI